MPRPSPLRLVLLAAAALPIAATAGDMLPLKHGIYVPVGHACKGASNAEMVNYWGGKSSIGVAQATCTIRKVSHVGTAYTYTDLCHDIASGEAVTGDPVKLTIANPAQFTMNGTTFRYCGPKVQF